MISSNIDPMVPAARESDPLVEFRVELTQPVTAE